jgi:hypothetical protein
MPSNISLQQVIDYATTKIRGAPLADVLGIQNEPALSICNDVYQETLQAPLTWRFNKANTAGTGFGINYFTTLQYAQDYALTNGIVSNCPYSGQSSNPYPAGGLNPGNGVQHIPTVYNNGLVITGGTATVTTNWAHGLKPAQTVYFQNIGQWANQVFVADTSGLINGVAIVVATVPSTTTFTFTTTATAGIYGAPGINDIGWIERTVFEDYANTATVKPRHSIEVTMNLEMESIVQPPFKISYQYTTADAGLAAGARIPSTTAWFRLWPLPSSQIWGIITDYQLAPVTFTDLSNNWGVWPDPLIFVIRQGVVAAAFDFAEDPRATTAYQLYLSNRDSVREIRDQERPSQTMFPDRPIMYGG